MFIVKKVGQRGIKMFNVLFGDVKTTIRVKNVANLLFQFIGKHTCTY